MKKIVPSFIELILIILVVMLLSWFYWIFSSALTPNELSDTINPLITLVTIFFLWLNWKQLKEELNEVRRVNKKYEDIKIGASSIVPIKNKLNLLEQIGRGGNFDPLGKIELKLKNFGVFPVYLNSINLVKTDINGTETLFTDAGFIENNFIFPGVETNGRLNICAPNRPNIEDKGIKLRYELVFSDDSNIKTLEIHFRYIGYMLENGELWYIPTKDRVCFQKNPTTIPSIIH